MKLFRISRLPQKLLFTGGYLLLVGLLRFVGITCIFQAVLGIPCPGCGITRALMSAARLDWQVAFAYNFMFPAVPIMYLSFLFDGKLFPQKWMDGALWVLIGVGFLAVWLTKLF